MTQMSSNPKNVERRAVAHPVERQNCKNCGMPLVGDYCHKCGQRHTDSVGPLRQLLAEGFREVSNLESKFLATLWSLISRPGQLTAAYLEGRRASFMSPLRLYVLTSVLLGAALVFSDDTVVVTMQGADPDRTAWLRFWVWSVLFMMPVFAGLLVLTTGRRRYFAEHLVLTIHLHAFAFLVVSVVLPVLEIGSTPALDLGLLVAAPAVILAYFVIAIRRRYALRWPRAILVSVAVGVGYVFVQLVALVATVGHAWRKARMES